VYQLAVWGSCNVRTTGIFDEVVMAELCDGVGTVAMAGTHKAQERASTSV
jgi:hypothetical protein